MILVKSQSFILFIIKLEDFQLVLLDLIMKSSSSISGVKFSVIRIVYLILLIGGLIVELWYANDII